MSDSSYPSRFTEFFGPSMWKTLHSIAWNYGADPHTPTETEQKEITDFFNLLTNLIPCPQCRTHYKNYIIEHLIDPSSRVNLTKWLHTLHNDVNRRTGKMELSYEDHSKDYNEWNSKTIHRFQGLTKQQQVQQMADPHLGRNPSPLYDTLFITLGAFVLGGVAVQIYNRQKKQ